MNRSALIFTFACIVMSVGEGMAESRVSQTEKEKKVNVGIRVGFNSSMFLIDRFSVGETEIQNVQNNYKVGYFGSFFCRFNLKKHHFIQPELQYNIAKGSISAPRSKENNEYLADNALIRSKIHSINMPVLYGYKFVDVSPYGMSFFFGPEISYTWDKYSKNEYSGFYQQGITETIHPFRFNGVLGLAVNVANVFFDFRYRVGLHNMVKGISFDGASTTPPHNTQEIVLKRRNNELSFSLGVIF